MTREEANNSTQKTLQDYLEENGFSVYDSEDTETLRRAAIENIIVDEHDDWISHGI